MLHSFDLEDFTRMVVRKLEEDKTISVILTNPSSDANYPVRVVSLPMENIKMTDDNNNPIKKVFQITIENWHDSKYESMKLYQKVNDLLRSINLLQVGNSNYRYDENTKKNIVGANYQVNYNAITNSLEKIK